jgi:hypothetical protein
MRTNFEKAFKRGTEGLKYESSGFCYTCETCLDNHDICCEHKAKRFWERGDIADEGHFSWQPCDFCGSRLGGDRYAAHAIFKDDETETIEHFEICEDCIFYMANGDLPENWG